MAEARMLIDGKLVEAASGATYGNVNPATEEVPRTPLSASGASSSSRTLSTKRRRRCDPSS